MYERRGLSDVGVTVLLGRGLLEGEDVRVVEEAGCGGGKEGGRCR